VISRKGRQHAVRGFFSNGMVATCMSQVLADMWLVSHSNTLNLKARQKGYYLSPVVTVSCLMP